MRYVLLLLIAGPLGSRRATPQLGRCRRSQAGAHRSLRRARPVRACRVNGPAMYLRELDRPPDRPERRLVLQRCQRLPTRAHEEHTRRSGAVLHHATRLVAPARVEVPQHEHAQLRTARRRHRRMHRRSSERIRVVRERRRRRPARHRLREQRRRHLYAIAQGGIAAGSIFLRLALGAAYTPTSISDDELLAVVLGGPRRRAVRPR